VTLLRPAAGSAARAAGPSSAGVRVIGRAAGLLQLAVSAPAVGSWTLALGGPPHARAPLSVSFTASLGGR
jgi:hypothetical protein